MGRRPKSAEVRGRFWEARDPQAGGNGGGSVPVGGPLLAADLWRHAPETDEASVATQAVALRTL